METDIWNETDKECQSDCAYDCMCFQELEEENNRLLEILTDELGMLYVE